MENFSEWLSTLGRAELRFECAIRNLTQHQHDHVMRQQIEANPFGVVKNPSGTSLRRLATQYGVTGREVAVLMNKLRDHPAAQPIQPRISESRFWIRNVGTELIQLESVLESVLEPVLEPVLDPVLESVLEPVLEPVLEALTPDDGHEESVQLNAQASVNDNSVRDGPLVGNDVLCDPNLILKTGLYASVLNNLIAMQSDGCKDAVLVFDYAKFRGSLLSTDAVIVLDIYLFYVNDPHSKHFVALFINLAIMITEKIKQLLIALQTDINILLLISDAESRNVAAFNNLMNPFANVTYKHLLFEGLNQQVYWIFAMDKWKIGTSIGSGGFGEIYSACKVESSEDYSYAVKFEPHDNGPLFFEKNVYMKLANLADIENFRKQRKLTTLGMPYYVGSGTFDFNDSKHRFLVIPRYGRDIWSFFLENGKKLPQPTVYRIAIQMLDVLEYIHQCNYIHADLKGANILLGYGNSGASQVYLVDLGLASHITKDFKPDKKKMHNGTIEYTSRDAHNGLITMRSDMEILAYNIIHWCGITLPWEADGLLAAPKKVQESKEKFMSDVVASLKRYYPACSDAITSYLKYVTTLTVDATPDYQKCRKMFETALKQLGEKNVGHLKFTLSPNVGSTTQSKVNTASPKKRVVRAQDKLLNETLTDDSSLEMENKSPPKKAPSLRKRVEAKNMEEVPAKRLKTTPTDELNVVTATKSTANKSTAKSQQKILNEPECGDLSTGENKSSSKKASPSRKRAGVDISKKASKKRLKTTSMTQVNDVVATQSDEPLKKRAAKSQSKKLDELESGDSSSSENKSPSKETSSSRKRVGVDVSKKASTKRLKTTSMTQVNDVLTKHTDEPLKKEAAKSQQKTLDELENGDSSSGENKSPSKQASSASERVAVSKAKISKKVAAKRQKTTPVPNDVENGKVPKSGNSKNGISDNEEEVLPNSIEVVSKIRAPKKTRR